MNKKRISGMLAAFLLTTTMSLAGTPQGISINAEGAQTGAVDTAYMTRTLDGFNSSDFTVENNDAKTGTFGSVTFADCSVAKESSVAYTEELTGEYAVEFYIGDCAQAGAKSYLWVNLGSTTLAIKADSILNAEESAYVIHPNNKNGFMVSCYVAFIVNEEGNVDVYQEKTSIDTTTHSPRGTYQLNNADFSLTNGCLSIQNGLSSNATNLTISVSRFRVSCEEKGVDGAVSFDQLTGSKVSKTANFLTIDTGDASQAATLKSKFAISDEGVADGEKVFEMTYSVFRNTGNSNGNIAWGVGFGLDQADETIDSNSAVYLVFNNFKAYSGVDSKTCTYHTNMWIDAKITGYAGGKLEAAYYCLNGNYGCKTWHTVTVENVDFDGYFAFGTWGASETNKQFEVKNFTFTGNTSYTLENSLVMDGASIRISTENSGLRFTAQTPVSTLKDLNALGTVEYGILYKDTLELEDNVLTLENYESVGAGKTVFTKETTSAMVEGVEYARFNFAFYNIPAADYTTERTVRFYAKVTLENGEEVVYYSDMMSRSVDYVATEAYNDRKPTEQGEYVHLTEDGDYSYMTEAQLAIVKGFIVED